MRRSTVLISATVGFAVLYLVATSVLGSPPDAGDDAATIASWFGDHDGNVRAWLWLLTISSPLFAVYAALVRNAMPAPVRDVFFVGAIAFIAETAVQGWIWGALALHPGATSTSTTQLLFDAASYWGPVLTSTTVMMLAPVVVLTFTGDDRWPAWLGGLAAIAVVEQLVETITVFGKSGFIAPGGPMNVYLGAALTAIALIALGFVAARRLDVPPVTTLPATTA